MNKTLHVESKWEKQVQWHLKSHIRFCWSKRQTVAWYKKNLSKNSVQNQLIWTENAELQWKSTSQLLALKVELNRVHRKCSKVSLLLKETLSWISSRVWNYYSVRCSTSKTEKQNTVRKVSDTNRKNEGHALKFNFHSAEDKIKVILWNKTEGWKFRDWKLPWKNLLFLFGSKSLPSRSFNFLLDTSENIWICSYK